MSRQRAIDIETSFYDDEYITISGKPKLVLCEHRKITDICYRCEKKELIPILRMEKKLFQKGKQKKHHQKFHIESEKTLIISGIKKYPQTTTSIKHAMHYIEVVPITDTYWKNKESFSNDLTHLNQISFSCGLNTFIKMPNTKETRYEILYDRINKPLYKMADDLVKMIIDYLLYDDGWQYNIYWDIQLLNNF